MSLPRSSLVCWVRNGTDVPNPARDTRINTNKHTNTHTDRPFCTICIIVFPIFTTSKIARDFSISYSLSPIRHIGLSAPDGKLLDYKQIQFPEWPTDWDRDCGEGIYLCSNWAWQQGEDTHFQTAPYESRGRWRPHERKFLHILYLINLSKFCSCLLLYFLYAWFIKKTFSVVITQWRKVCCFFVFFFKFEQHGWCVWSHLNSFSVNKKMLWLCASKSNLHLKATFNCIQTPFLLQPHRDLCLLLETKSVSFTFQLNVWTTTLWSHQIQSLTALWNFLQDTLISSCYKAMNLALFLVSWLLVFSWFIICCVGKTFCGQWWDELAEMTWDAFFIFVFSAAVKSRQERGEDTKGQGADSNPGRCISATGHLSQTGAQDRNPFK